jgi:hypothetical protein
MPACLSRRAIPCVEGLEPRICLTTWYVAPTGLDVNPGTQGAPFGSLAGAAAAARAGDTVLVMAGVYPVSTTQMIPSIGAADGPITFEPDPGQTVIIDGGGLPAGSPAVDITGRYINFENFEVRNSTGADVQVTGQNVQVIDDTMDGAQRQGILVGSGNSLTTADNVLVQASYIYNDDLSAASGAETSGPAGALQAPLAAAQTDGAAEVNFSGNYIHDNHGAGLDMLLVDGGDVSTNVIHDNTGVQVALDNATGVTIEQNFIYNTSETQFYTKGAPAVSIELTNGQYALSNPLDEDRIQNNIVLFGSINLQYSNVGSGAGMRNTVIANNDFYAAAGPMPVNVSIDASAGHLGNLVADNIFDQPTGTQALLGGGNAASTGLTGFIFEYNNWFQSQESTVADGGAGIGAGTGDVYSDPLLSAPGVVDPAAYKLQVNSPDVDAAIPVAGVTVDYYDIPRPQGKAPDIGAHEYVVGTTPTTPTRTGYSSGPVGVPTGLAATAPNPYEIDLTWGDPWGEISGFAIQRQSVNGWVTVGFAGTSPGTGNYAFTGTYDDTGLKPNHRYTYRISGFFTDNTVTKDSKNFSFKTPPVPKPPKVPKVPKPPKVHKPKPVKVGKKVVEG